MNSKQDSPGSGNKLLRWPLRKKYTKYTKQPEYKTHPRSIFARSALAVTSSEKSSVITNRKSTTRFPMSPRWTSYMPPKGGSKTQSVQLLLITNRKSHTSFRLVPTSMTLNDLERRSSPYFAFFTEFLVIYVTVVEYRPIMSVNIVSQFQVSIFGHSPPTLQRSLCGSWATCFEVVIVITCINLKKTKVL